MAAGNTYRPRRAPPSAGAAVNPPACPAAAAFVTIVSPDCRQLRPHTSESRNCFAAPLPRSLAITGATALRSRIARRLARCAAMQRRRALPT